MAKLSTPVRTFSPIFALAHLFRSNPGHGHRVSECVVLAVMVTGRKAKNNAEIVAAIQPAIDAGLVLVQTYTFAPKGCPGGKPRPALVPVDRLDLTDAGMAAVAEQYPAVDAWRAEVEADRRANFLAEIAVNLTKVSAEQAASARVAGEIPGGRGEGPTMEALQAAPMRNLINVWHVLRVAVSQLPR